MANKRSSKPTSSAEASSASSQSGDQAVDFEESLREVEQIVARLESGELGLTESLNQYETGIRELKRCHALLEAAEQRVCLLSGFDADGNPITEPLKEESVESEPKKKRRVKKKVARPRPSAEVSDSPKQTKPRPNSVDDSPGLF